MEHPKVRNDNRPLYVRAEEALVNLLESGRYLPGDRLPPEPELAQQMGISRSTLREAMRTFEERGLITRKQGVGTFLNATSSLFIESGLETLESVDRLARRRGLEVETKGLSIRPGTASADVARVLNIEPRSPILSISRTKVGAGQPIAFIVDTLPAGKISPSLIQEMFQGSVLDLLLEHLTPPPAYARAEIIPVLSTTHLCQHLSVKRTTPLLLLVETLFDTTGTPISYSENYFVPGFFSFHVIRRVSS